MTKEIPKWKLREKGADLKNMGMDWAQNAYQKLMSWEKSFKYFRKYWNQVAFWIRMEEQTKYWPDHILELNSMSIKCFPALIRKFLFHILRLIMTWVVRCYSMMKKYSTMCVHQRSPWEVFIHSRCPSIAYFKTEQNLSQSHFIILQVKPGALHHSGYSN